MREDGTKYGTDYERYRISGIVHLDNLADNLAQQPLSPSFKRDQNAIKERLAREASWDPTLKRNRLTARITKDTWLRIARQPSVPLQDDREYPILVVPEKAEIVIDEGAALLTALKSRFVGSLRGTLGNQPSSAGWCVVDFLVDGECHCMISISKVLRP
jgi:hypothetical protein